MNDIRGLPLHLRNATTTDTGLHVISGTAVVFNQPSKNVGFIEYVDSDAFAGVDLSKVQLWYNHNSDNVLARVDAKTLQLSLNENGLDFVATLPDTTLGHDVFTDIQNGNLQGCSFQFTIADDDWQLDQHGNKIHTIHAIKSMVEISITPLPVYTSTSITVQRSLEKLNKEAKNLNNEEKTAAKSAADSEKPNTNTTPASQAGDNQTAAGAVVDDILKLLKQKLSGPDTNKRDDDTTDQDVELNSTENKPVAATSAAAADKSATSTAPSATAKPATSAVPTKRAATSAATSTQNQPKEGEKPMQVIKPKEDKAVVQKRSLYEFLRDGKTEKRADDNNIVLDNGSVIIPQDILTPEHEQHQFPRLGSMVRTVSVKHTTGKLPVFQTSDETLSLHKEFTQSTRNKVPEIIPINWDLKTYTGSYAFSQDLISDSDYNWESELNSRLLELRDNTNDQQIITALTSGIAAVNVADNLVGGLKTALNVNLKPMDSAAASIVLSQSAFNALDQMKDTMGRPLVQPDVTKSTGQSILGKTVITLDDVLFPKAKAGDVNMIVAPLQKAVINFKNNEITGRFMDTYDVWYKLLGIYLRQDVVQARKDLIVYLTGNATATTTPAAQH